MAEKKTKAEAGVAMPGSHDNAATADPAPAPPAEQGGSTASSAPPVSEAIKQHLEAHLGEAELHTSIVHATQDVACKPLRISVQNLRANSKAFVVIRDDQAAVWSEGEGKGLVGLSVCTSRDPALYVRNFLINAREFYVQTYNTCQEIVISLYVRTAQPSLRGRIDLPPGAILTLQSTTERVSLVGLSAFTIDF